MTLSGWTSIWIVAGALAFGSCAEPTESEAYQTAVSAIADARSVRTDLEIAYRRMDSLEDRIAVLEERLRDRQPAPRATGDRKPGEVILPEFVFEAPPN